MNNCTVVPEIDPLEQFTYSENNGRFLVYDVPPSGWRHDVDTNSATQMIEEEIPRSIRKEFTQLLHRKYGTPLSFSIDSIQFMWAVFKATKTLPE